MRRDGRTSALADTTSGTDAPAGAQAAPPSGLIDLTHPAAFAWWRNAHEALFKAGVDVIETDGGGDVPERRDRFQRRHRPAPAQRLSAAVQPLRFRSGRKVRAAGTGATAGLEQCRLERQPALSGAMERRDAKRLGGTGGQYPRQPVERYERRAVSRLRSRRRLWRGARVGGALCALAAGRRFRFAPPTSCQRRARTVGARPGPGKNRAAVAGIPLPAAALPRHRHGAGRPRQACR